MRAALGDIMDRRPHQLGSVEPDPLPEKLTAFLREQGWIADAVVRVREKGREFVAEAVVVPRGEPPSLEAIERASLGAEGLDERLRNVALTPVSEIPRDLQRVRADQPEGMLLGGPEAG